MSAVAITSSTSFSIPFLISFFVLFSFFFFNDTATTEIYTLSLHDALPISTPAATPSRAWPSRSLRRRSGVLNLESLDLDRKSTRLNSSHRCISYAVFCLKKKKKKKKKNTQEQNDNVIINLTTKSESIVLTC